jgi:hypothetical protein
MDGLGFCGVIEKEHTLVGQSANRFYELDII